MPKNEKISAFSPHVNFLRDNYTIPYWTVIPLKEDLPLLGNRFGEIKYADEFLSTSASASFEFIKCIRYLSQIMHKKQKSKQQKANFWLSEGNRLKRCADP